MTHLPAFQLESRQKVKRLLRRKVLKQATEGTGAAIFVWLKEIVPTHLEESQNVVSEQLTVDLF